MSTSSHSFVLVLPAMVANVNGFIQKWGGLWAAKVTTVEPEHPRDMVSSGPSA